MITSLTARPMGRRDNVMEENNSKRLNEPHLQNQILKLPIYLLG